MHDSGAGGERPEHLNFIRDEPSDEDFFKSHSRLARAVAAAVRGQPGLKVVGLLGPWGSGKSTAIRLLQKELVAKPDGIETYCFSYDAWLQQNDPPRRAFLETLLHFLIDDTRQPRLTTAERWKKRLGQLTGSVEESETQHTPTLTTAGRWLLGSFLLVPLGVPLLGYETISAAFGSHPTALARGVLATGALLTLLPAVVAFGLYLYWRPKGWPLKSETWINHRHPHEEDSIISVVLNKAIHTTKTKTLRAPEPTTIEFQDIFREIMEGVAADNRRFVFIIDNLDRLPEQEAVAMWGTIRSFFLGSIETQTVRKVAALPTVILPIDRDAVKRMYAVTHKNDADGLAQSFMDKTFDLTFRVPKPVTSDWKAYLARQFRIVFGELISDDEIYNVCCFYEEASRETNIEITPRTINGLVNNIGTLWLQWHDIGITLDALSYYTVYQKTIENDISAAVNRPNAGIDEIDPVWKQSVAAIYFGAEPDIAVQILIEQPLRDAIASFGTDGFSRHASVPGFERILQRAIVSGPQGPKGPDPRFLGNAARLLDAANLPQGAPLAAAWRSLCDAFSKAAPWDAPSTDANLAIAIVLKHCQPASLDALLRALASKVSATEPAGVTAAPAQEAFIAIARTLKDAAAAASLSPPALLVPGDAATYLGLLAQALGEPDVMKQLTTKITAADLVQRLVAGVSDEQASPTVEAQTKALVTRGGSVPWASLIQAATEIVRHQNGGQRVMVGALGVLSALYVKEAAAAEAVKQLSSESVLYNRLVEAKNANSRSAVVTAIALLLANGTSIPPVGGATWVEPIAADANLIPEVDEVLRQIKPNASAAIVALAKANAPVAPLVKSIITRRIQDGALGRLALLDVIKRVPDWFDCMPSESRDEFIGKVSTYETFWERLAEADFSGNALLFYHSLLKTGGGVNAPISVAARARLESVTEGQWISAIKGGVEPLQVAQAYAEANGELRLGANLEDALHSLIEDVVSNDDAALRQRWFATTDFLSNPAKKMLVVTMRDRVLNGGAVGGLVNLLAASDEQLVKLGDFEGRADDAVRHVLRELVGSEAGESWLVAHAQTSGAWVSRSDAISHDYLAGRLKEMWLAADETHRQRLAGLAEAWSLGSLAPPPPPPEVDESATEIPGETERAEGDS